jgi:uncharacterized protein YheU (UPF0270 family)
VFKANLARLVEGAVVLIWDEHHNIERKQRHPR